MMIKKLPLRTEFFTPMLAFQTRQLSFWNPFSNDPEKEMEKLRKYYEKEQAEINKEREVIKESLKDETILGGEKFFYPNQTNKFPKRKIPGEKTEEDLAKEQI